MTSTLDIRDYLRSFTNEQIIYWPNPGNAGDSLIAHGTYQLFRELGINFQNVAPSDDLTNQTLVIGGGGNFVSLYWNVANFLGSWHQRARRVVILPHTVSGHEELIAQLGQNVEIICRERKSYDHVRGVNPSLSTFLADDMALSIDVQKTREDAKNKLRGGETNRRFFYRNLKRSTKTTYQRLRDPKNGISSGGVLYAMRSDPSERTSDTYPKANFDVSQHFSADAMDEMASLDAAYAMFGFLDRYEKLITNRLHVCIAGILLNKQVEFFPNSYWKNQAVYEFSIAGKFPNVTWMGEGAPSLRPTDSAMTS